VAFKEALEKVLQLEGGLRLYRNPTEQAETYAGIYRKAHPDWVGWNYVDRGQNPPFGLIEKFYYENFYKHFEKIKSEKIRDLLFETAVNLGIKQTVKLIQRTLGLTADGILGPKTLSAINSVNSEEFIKDFTLTRIAFYTALTNRNPKRYAIYLRGWINRTLEALSWAYSLS